MGAGGRIVMFVAIYLTSEDVVKLNRLDVGAVQQLTHTQEKLAKCVGQEPMVLYKDEDGILTDYDLSDPSDVIEEG
jgi:hypothetical protein